MLKIYTQFLTSCLFWATYSSAVLSGEVIKRDIIVQYDTAFEATPNDALVHPSAEMTFNYTRAEAWQVDPDD